MALIDSRNTISY